MVVPSEEEVERRRIVGVNAETVTDVAATDFPHHYPYEDASWSLAKFRKGLKIQFHKDEKYDSVFSLIGVDASIANAFRRILIAEIPTLAIEEVYIFNNTSIIQDEVLAHRLGLIPLTGNPEGFRWLQWFRKPDPEDPSSDSKASVPSDYNTIVLDLNISCTWSATGKARAKQGETDPNLLYTNSNVYARDITFSATGQQSRYFDPEHPEKRIRPVNPDILIAKLRPGQEIRLRMHCIKGVGGDHAKFSPVATASYRLLPSITLTAPIRGADARKFARCFPKGVIGLEADPETGEATAVVTDVMKDTVSRECLRHAEFKDKVSLGRVLDHFVFGVESTGQMPSDELFIESVRILRAKADRFKSNLADVSR